MAQALSATPHYIYVCVYVSSYPNTI